MSRPAKNIETDQQNIIRQQAEEITAARQALLDEIAIHEQVVMDLQRSNAELRRSQKRTGLMLRSIQAAGGSLVLIEVLKRIAGIMPTATGMPYCGIYLFDEEKDLLVRHAGTANLTSEQIAKTEHLQIDPARFPLIQEAFEEQRPVICQDIRTDPRVPPEALPQIGIRSMLVIPISLGSRTLGMALNYTIDKIHDITQEDIELASGVANSVALAVENARLYEETRQRLAESQGVQRVTTSLLRKGDLEEILAIICNEAINLTEAAGSAVLLRNPDGSLDVTSAAGEPLAAIGRLPADSPLTGPSALSIEPLICNKMTAPGSPGSAIHSLLAVPLQIEAKGIGILDVFNKVGGFTGNDLRIISLFAGQAAIVIEQTRLHQQIEQMAVMEERQRLARELHDSVTQALYSINLFAEAARRALTAGKEQKALENIGKLREMTREAILEMRLLIFELHPLILEEQGLIAALQARLAAVESRSGLHTAIRAEGETRLPITVEKELYRIVQEGLNNIVRHTQAENISITVTYRPDAVLLELQDDGAGFDLDAAGSSGGMGLRNMEERVARIGGSFTVQTAPGAGTRLSVNIPLGTTK